MGLKALQAAVDMSQTDSDSQFLTDSSRSEKYSEIADSVEKLAETVVTVAGPASLGLAHDVSAVAAHIVQGADVESLPKVQEKVATKRANCRA